MSELKITGTISPALKIGGDISKARELSGIVEKAQSVIEKDYDKLINRPKINSVELKGDKNFNDLGLQALSNFEIAQIINGL